MAFQSFGNPFHRHLPRCEWDASGRDPEKYTMSYSRLPATTESEESDSDTLLPPQLVEKSSSKVNARVISDVIIGLSDA